MSMLFATSRTSATGTTEIVRNITVGQQNNPLARAIDVLLLGLTSAPVATVCIGLFVWRMVIAYRDTDTEKGKKVFLTFMTVCIIVISIIPVAKSFFTGVVDSFLLNANK